MVSRLLGECMFVCNVNRNTGPSTYLRFVELWCFAVRPDSSRSNHIVKYATTGVACNMWEAWPGRTLC